MSTHADTSTNNALRGEEGYSMRLAVFFSAATCPGAGHFVQRRWIMGAIYIVAFLTCLTTTFITVLAPLFANLRIAMDFAESGSNESMRTIPVIKVLTWLGLSVSIYLAAIADIVIYARRQNRRRLEAQRKNIEQTG